MSKNIETLNALMADKAFVEKIANLEEPEDVQAAFAEKGVDFSIEEINTIAEMVMNNGSEELGEGDMEAVTGGILAEIAIVASGISLFAGIMTEVNNSRKAKGKKGIW